MVEMAERHLRALERSARNLEKAKEARRVAVQLAYESGESMATIARHVGLSEARVRQIIHGK